MPRLYKNKNGYFGEKIDIHAVISSCLTHAKNFKWEIDEIATLNTHKIFAFRRYVSQKFKNVYISTGIHGDEPAGPLAVETFLASNIFSDNLNLWIIPCLNPTGFIKGTRENNNNIDLNRDYLKPKTKEIRAHIKWLENQPLFDLTLCIHEDWESVGYYIYGDTQPQANKILEAVKSIVPIEKNLILGESKVVDGIVKVSEKERFKIHPEAMYLTQYKKGIHFTLESPSDFEIKERVSAHITAINAVLKYI